jgi:hypothetical protein
MILPKSPLSVDTALQRMWDVIHYDDGTSLFVKRGNYYKARDHESELETPTVTSAPSVTVPSTGFTQSVQAVNKAPAPAGPPAGPPPGPPPSNNNGFFDGPPPPPPPPKPSSSQPCLSSGGTLTYSDANGTVYNYTNLGGGCVGLDVGESNGTPSNSTSSGGGGSMLHDPFYASITPQTFALAGATIASAIILILLFLSRTRKPWTQKLAAFSMAVSLVTYMVVSVNMLEQQYIEGRYDADALRGVNQETVCKVFAFIAAFVIYLAQMQTLMRIFPRKRDKVIIKWTGLCLIALTMIFCALSEFLQPSAPPPDQRSTAWQIFMQILPPLNYLFSIALAVIYAACIFYFVFVHRRQAFTVPAGLILALLSIGCVLLPIIFFCLDIWATFVVGWGQYIRSIGAIGSAVIVWEWIERVDEAETKSSGKSGILGRRIFEDELDAPRKSPPSQDGDSVWRDWGRKIRVPSIFSGISDKASEWSLKIQSKLDRRASTPTPPPVTELALSDLNSTITTHEGATFSTPTASEDTQTSVTGDDTYASTSYTGTSGASSFSPLVGGKRPKKRHLYPVARSNRTRELTRTQSTRSHIEPIRESVFQPSTSHEPSAPSLHESDSASLHGRPRSSNAPSFHSREDDGAGRFSVLPGFTSGDYFLDPAEMHKRGWAEDERIQR